MTARREEPTMDDYEEADAEDTKPPCAQCGARYARWYGDTLREYLCDRCHDDDEEL